MEVVEKITKKLLISFEFVINSRIQFSDES